jgi:hypothetical protein
MSAHRGRVSLIVAGADIRRAGRRATADRRLPTDDWDCPTETDDRRLPTDD